MDLKLVIAELRAELESIDQVTAALEKLVQLRHGRGGASVPDEVTAISRRARVKKAPETRAMSASGE